MEQTPISPAESAVDALARFLPPDIGIAPLIAVTRALAGFNRDQLGGTIEVLVALLDAVDGDPDAEADDRGGETVAIVDNPDLPPEEGEDDPDLEQTFDEDDWYEHAASGPGCPVSDPGGAGEGEDDERDGTDEGDISWAEWHTLPAASRRAGRTDGTSADGWVQAIHEDTEDDDPAGQRDEDGVNTELWALRGDHGPGCTISDPDYGVDDQPQDNEAEPLPAFDWGDDQTKGPLPVFPGTDRRIMASHRNYIRAERCDRFVRYGESFYRLRDPDGLTRFIKAAELPG